MPRSGWPVWTLHWFLSWYARELPNEARRDFLEMKFGDLLRLPVDNWLDHPIVSELSEEGRWQLASTTAGIFRKPL